MGETGGVPVRSITDMNADVIDYVQSIVTVDKSGGVPDYQWSHKLSGTVNVNVVDALATQHAAQSLNRDQLRAAEATLDLLEPFYGKPASGESDAAMKEARPILDSLGTTASDLGKVVQWLRQTKIPGLYAERTRIGQATRVEAGVKSGVDNGIAEAAGNAYRDADLQEWTVNEARAEQGGDYLTVASYERRFGAWYNQRSAAERTESRRLAEEADKEHAKGRKADAKREQALRKQSADFQGWSKDSSDAATGHLDRALAWDAKAASQAAAPPPPTTPREATLERAQQRGAEEAIRLYKAFQRIAESVADTRIRWALDR